MIIVYKKKKNSHIDLVMVMLTNRNKELKKQPRHGYTTKMETKNSQMA